MADQKADIRLLPNGYKKVGFLVIGIGFLLFILFSINLAPVNSELSKTLLLQILLLGLLILALSREKNETQRTTRIRIRALASSFVFAVAFVIVMPIVNIFFVGSFKEGISADQLMLTMLLWYFGIFISGKKLS